MTASSGHQSTADHGVEGAGMEIEFTQSCMQFHNELAICVHMDQGMFTFHLALCTNSSSTMLDFSRGFTS